MEQNDATQSQNSSGGDPVGKHFIKRNHTHDLICMNDMFGLLDILALSQYGRLNHSLVMKNGKCEIS